MQQWEERNKAFKDFDGKVKSGNVWLGSMEDRVSQLQPIASDKETINVQMQQLQVLNNFDQSPNGDLSKLVETN